MKYKIHINIKNIEHILIKNARISIVQLKSSSSKTVLSSRTSY